MTTDKSIHAMMVAIAKGSYDDYKEHYKGKISEKQFAVLCRQYGFTALCKVFPTVTPAVANISAESTEVPMPTIIGLEAIKDAGFDLDDL